MLNLHTIQAEFGDCFVLEFGTAASPRYMLIDGGPPNIYNDHLKGVLQTIKKRGADLDLVVLSHVDNDHVSGLLDLMADIEDQRTNHQPEIATIKSLWHNSFSQTIGKGNEIEPRLKSLMMNAKQASVLSNTGMAFEGIGEGARLRLYATQLGIPLNPQLGSQPILVDTVPEAFSVANLTLHVIGPSEENLKALQKEWMAWLDKHEEAAGSADPAVAAKADKSVPNLSSIMLLAQADGKKLLLTGDGRGDHMIQGLEEAKLLDADGHLHVDVFKLPHHGSDRNVTREVFETITADVYIVSANGRYDNPDLSTLIWVVETAHAEKRPIQIIATNDTIATKRLVQSYGPKEYGYELVLMPVGEHSMELPLAR